MNGVVQIAIIFKDVWMVMFHVTKTAEIDVENVEFVKSNNSVLVMNVKYAMKTVVDV